MSRSVLFWYLRISRSATVPGRKRFSARVLLAHTRAKTRQHAEEEYYALRGCAWAAPCPLVRRPAAEGPASLARPPGGRPPVLFRAVAGRDFFPGGGGVEGGESSACLRFPRWTVCAILEVDRDVGAWKTRTLAWRLAVASESSKQEV